ncbi:hypothetical protein [Pseudocolwellia agarivorans]|uniref:hypothetical protein n=1 Tax=Pseudocolwellia agarivorans TaxID=1911682 RepID=UPI000984E291|nr:hypothetical protein [Pseudocolwellia agarivorans]
MNIALKAVLLSALVYPGVGHYILNKRIACAVLACAFTLPLLFLFSDIFQVAHSLADQISAGQIPLDIIEIRHQIDTELASMTEGSFSYYLYGLGIIWLIGIIDSYRLGKAESHLK